MSDRISDRMLEALVMRTLGYSVDRRYDGSSQLSGNRRSAGAVKLLADRLRFDGYVGRRKPHTDQITPEGSDTILANLDRLPADLVERAKAWAEQAKVDHAQREREHEAAEEHRQAERRRLTQARQNKLRERVPAILTEAAERNNIGLDLKGCDPDMIVAFYEDIQNSAAG